MESLRGSAGPQQAPSPRYSCWEELMQIKVNGETDGVPENATIRDILTARALQEDIVIVLLNDDMVKTEAWNTVRVHADDRIEIIKVVGGG